jgi:hypothetical protein
MDTFNILSQIELPEIPEFNLPKPKIPVNLNFDFSRISNFFSSTEDYLKGINFISIYKNTEAALKEKGLNLYEMIKKYDEHYELKKKLKKLDKTDRLYKMYKSRFRINNAQITAQRFQLVTYFGYRMADGIIRFIVFIVLSPFKIFFYLIRKIWWFLTSPARLVKAIYRKVTSPFTRKKPIQPVGGKRKKTQKKQKRKKTQKKQKRKKTQKNKLDKK